ncbi:MAG: hypothetical protein JNM42_10290 [Propionivibrio sp.]|nr:hypothetical protein [Propionivibrio sp.]MBL8414813.1 hypothetical protein [Propionivibrio sp.]
MSEYALISGNPVFRDVLDKPLSPLTIRCRKARKRSAAAVIAIAPG